MAVASRRCSATIFARHQHLSLPARALPTSSPSTPSLTAGLSSISCDQKRTPRRNDLHKRSELSPGVQSRLAAFEEEILANPFYRMLSSPLRRCIITRQIMPKDLLIAIKPAFLPPEPPSVEEGDPLPSQTQEAEIHEAFLPDSILHPYFVPTKPGPSAYFAARKMVMRVLIEDFTGKRSPRPRDFSRTESSRKRAGPHPLRGLSHSAFLPDRIEEMITHQLQTRVLQEVQLLLLMREKSAKSESKRERDVLVIEGTPPISILDFSSAPSPEEDASGPSVLPLHYHISSLFDLEQTGKLRDTLAQLVERDLGDKIELPQMAELGPLAVALWRLRNWVGSVTTTTTTTSTKDGL